MIVKLSESDYIIALDELKRYEEICHDLWMTHNIKSTITIDSFTLERAYREQISVDPHVYDYIRDLVSLGKKRRLELIEHVVGDADRRHVYYDENGYAYREGKDDLGVYRDYVEMGE